MPSVVLVIAAAREPAPTGGWSQTGRCAVYLLLTPLVTLPGWSLLVVLSSVSLVLAILPALARLLRLAVPVSRSPETRDHATEPRPDQDLTAHEPTSTPRRSRIALTPAAARNLSRRDRAQVLTVLGVRVPEPEVPDGGRVRRQLALGLLHCPVSVLLLAAVTAGWAAALALAGLPTYAFALPGRGKVGGIVLTDVGPLLFLTALGLVLLALAPRLTRTGAGLDVALVRTLLAPDHATQVQRLEQSRSAVLSAADAERQRIERDLHDGAQQRLVALTLTLGLARRALPSDAEQAGALLAEAHEQAKLALVELRDLVRGVHPAVLADRGLDAALSAVAACSPVPVTLDVKVDPRPSVGAEAAAYFLVTEALTNVAKHAQARSVQIDVRRQADRLRILVCDDGIGGARPTPGSGLTGLIARVQALQGDLTVNSPAGGPTRLEAELPCGS